MTLGTYSISHAFRSDDFDFETREIKRLQVKKNVNIMSKDVFSNIGVFSIYVVMSGP